MGALNVTLSDGRRRAIGLVLFGLAALLVLDVVYQIAMHVRWQMWIPNRPAATTTTRPAETQPTDSQPAGTQPADSQPGGPPAGPPGAAAPGVVEVAQVIRVRNIMAPAPPRGHGLNLTGVLGKTALFQSTLTNQPVAIDVGQTVQGVQVKSIDGYSVTIEHEGVEATLHLYPPQTPPPPPPGAPGAPQPGSPAPTGAGPTAAAAVENVENVAESQPAVPAAEFPALPPDASSPLTTQPEGAVP